MHTFLLFGQVYSGLFMFWYSLNPDQFYDDTWWLNFASLLLMLLYQLIHKEE